MKRQPVLLLESLILVVICATTAEGRRRGIPVILVFGQAEQIISLGELPSQERALAAEALGTQVKVGFHYKRFHLWYGDLWTWDGKHVLYAGDKYWIPTVSQWREILNGHPASTYGTPFFYRVPFLLALILSVIAIYVVKKKFFKSDAEKIQALFNNRKYRQALEYVVDRSKTESSLMLSVNQQAFGEAVKTLTGEGVRLKTAQESLGKMVLQVIGHNHIQVEAMLAGANELEEQGELAQSAAILEELVSVLPTSDERHGLALAKLTEIRGKLAVSAPMEIESSPTNELDDVSERSPAVVRAD